MHDSDLESLITHFEPTPEDILAKWQGILRLMDWDIILEDVDRDALGAQGKCWTIMRQAKAKVMLSKDLPPDEVELTIVHELLHVRLQGQDEDLEATPGMELGIERIAQALITRSGN